MRAESGRNRAHAKTWSGNPPSSVRGDMGALWRNPISEKRHRKQASPTHLCHRHATEPSQVKITRFPLLIHTICAHVDDKVADLKIKGFSSLWVFSLDAF